MQDRLQDGMREIKINAIDRARRFRPGGEAQELAAQVISACEDIESLFMRLDEFSQNAGDCYTQERYNILENVRSEVEKLLQNIGDCKYDIRQVDKSAARDPVVEVNTSPVSRVVESNSNGSFFDDARTAMYGGMAGAGMAAIVGGLIGSIVPGIGTIIGSTAGLAIASYLGGSAATDIKRSNELERAKQQAIGAVAQTISSAYQNLNENVQRVLADIESSVTRAMRDAVTHRQEDILNRRKELHSRQSETAAQLSVKRKELEANKREFSSIKDLVGRVI